MSLFTTTITHHITYIPSSLTRLTTCLLIVHHDFPMINSFPFNQLHIPARCLYAGTDLHATLIGQRFLRQESLLHFHTLHSKHQLISQTFFKSVSKLTMLSKLPQSRQELSNCLFWVLSSSLKSQTFCYHIWFWLETSDQKCLKFFITLLNRFFRQTQITQLRVALITNLLQKIQTFLLWIFHLMQLKLYLISLQPGRQIINFPLELGNVEQTHTVGPRDHISDSRHLRLIFCLQHFKYHFVKLYTLKFLNKIFHSFANVIYRGKEKISRSQR
uniref:Uncharacterized protein n=1 Tax=Cacopsylla melanoneura TaxID=428564 RepID=A0A8D9BHE8_9HEMI